MPFYGDDERITIAFNCWFGMRKAELPHSIGIGALRRDLDLAAAVAVLEA
jgi:hypothetical protein